MPHQPPKKDGLRKDGTSRRTRAGRENKAGTPRIMIVAVIVIIIGAAFLFWPKGSPVPTGIGEHQSIVTLPDSNSAMASSPRSGDVDINSQTGQLTPEKPENQNDNSTQEKPPSPKTETKPKTKTTSAPTTSQPKSIPAVKPGGTGGWAVQTGGFGNAANADTEAARLKDAGWNSMVRAGSNSQGDIVYRVWIGYFKSREQANTFIKQNQQNLVDAFAVHR